MSVKKPRVIGTTPASIKQAEDELNVTFPPSFRVWLRTYYAADGGAVLAEYTESGGSTTPAWSKSYIYLGARLLSTLTPNGSGGEAIQYHHPDRLGTMAVCGGRCQSIQRLDGMRAGTIAAKRELRRILQENGPESLLVEVRNRFRSLERDYFVVPVF